MESVQVAVPSEENNNAAVQAPPAVSPPKSALTPPPRPPPPPSNKLRDMKARQTEATSKDESPEGSIALRNKSVDAAAAQTAANQANRKSVMDLTAMFEKAPPAGRPVPPPRPNKSKVAPAAN